METEKTLAEIARSVLATDTPSDPGEFRQKAGLLALLCLLGIVESFYGGERVITTQDEGSAAQESDLIGTVSTLARKFLGERVEPTAPVPAASLLGSFSPRKTDAVPTESQVESPSDKPQGAPDNEIKEAAPTHPEPRPRPPSGLQEALGIDPRIITMGLNMLAEFMKNRPPDRPITSPPVEVPSARDRPSPPPQEPPQKLYHKPGRGIYRPKPDANS